MKELEDDGGWGWVDDGGWVDHRRVMPRAPGVAGANPNPNPNSHPNLALRELRDTTMFRLSRCEDRRDLSLPTLVDLVTAGVLTTSLTLTRRRAKPTTAREAYARRHRGRTRRRAAS